MCSTFYYLVYSLTPKRSTMKKHLRLFFSLMLLAGIALPFVGAKAQSNQEKNTCKYIRAAAGALTRTDIPSDFPVMPNTGDQDADVKQFKQALTDWKNAHPNTSDLDFTPPAAASSYFIEIPASELAKFSEDRRAAILSKAYFYKVTN